MPGYQAAFEGKSPSRPGRTCVCWHGPFGALHFGIKHIAMAVQPQTCVRPCCQQVCLVDVCLRCIVRPLCACMMGWVQMCADYREGKHSVGGGRGQLLNNGMCCWVCPCMSRVGGSSRVGGTEAVAHASWCASNGSACRCFVCEVACRHAVCTACNSTSFRGAGHPVLTRGCGRAC
jgi:hypothetical protein